MCLRLPLWDKAFRGLYFILLVAVEYLYLYIFYKTRPFSRESISPIIFDKETLNTEL